MMNMNVLIAIDSFKGSLSARKLVSAIEEGITNVYSDATIKKTPIADGGEGTIDSLIEGLRGQLIYKTVKGPLFEDVQAYYGILPDQKTAILEMAISSGLPLVPKDKRDPRYTTTYGVGELILDALDKQVREFIIGIGGSATNDGGIGMLAALGYRFYNADGQELSPVGHSLAQVHTIDTSKVDPRLIDASFLIACDVDNPLCGPRGASHTYGPQKGATKEIVTELDQGLLHFSSIVKERLTIDKANLAGAGAAGGLGYGFAAFLNGELKPGIDIVFEKLSFEKQLEDIDIIVTGEGQIDFQSVMGKALAGVARAAKKKNIPVIALGGSVTKDAYKMHDLGITSIFSVINHPISLEDAMHEDTAKEFMTRNVEELFRLIKTIKK
jgi:glycerate kinase